MRSKVKTTILVICLMAVNSVDSQVISICGNTRENTIVRAGIVHYETTSVHTIDGKRAEVNGFILYDLYLEAFIEASFRCECFYC